MSVCWTFMILMGCGLSHATQSQSNCACNARLDTICVPAGHNVTVPCPKPTATEVIFNLRHNGEMVYNRSCKESEGENALNCTTPNSGVGVELLINTTLAHFSLTGVNARSHGIYRCEAITMFPPPLTTIPGTLVILVLVEGHQCNINHTVPKPCVQDSGFHWILIIVIVSTYSIAVTISAIAIWVKMRKTDSQSDYMNTKPKAPRERRKKRGVQNPIPRHF